MPLGSPGGPLAAIAVFAAVVACPPLRPATAGAVDTIRITPAADLVRASLVAEAESIRAGEPFWVGVHLEMQEGWHVNWRNPGDAGLAPTVAWKLPAGFTAGEIEWPFPERFDLPELSIFGYAGDVLLMARITPPAALSGREIDLEARVEWLACAEACVPGEAKVSLSLPVLDRNPVAEHHAKRLFDTARRQLPVDSAPWRFKARVTSEQIIISAMPAGDSQGGVQAAPPPTAPANEVGEHRTHDRLVFYPDSPGIIENSAEQRLIALPSGYRLEIPRAHMPLELPPRLKGVLVSDAAWTDAGCRALLLDIPIN